MRRFLASLIAICVWISAPAFAGERLVTVPVRDGVTLTYMISQRDGSHPRYLFVMFPGYPGVLNFRQEEGAIAFDLKGNFLVRARRHFVDDEFATAIIDAPSDQFGAYEEAYRSSDQHAQDMIKVIASLHRELADVKLVLIGTSYGTVSTAHLGQRLAAEWDGVVHTSTVTRAGHGKGDSLTHFDYASIKTRQLFVHHAHDGCDICPYDRLKDIAKGNDIITVQGGKNEGKPCKAFAYHGFNGREQAVAQAIKAWVKREPYPRTLGE